MDRRFKVYGLRTDEGSALGMIEHNKRSNEATAIYSLYYPTKLSNRDIFVDAMQVMIVNSESEEVLKMTTALYGKYDWRRPYASRIRYVKAAHGSSIFTECRQLAEDALNRKETIIEKLI